MLNDMAEKKQIPLKWLVADSIYGNNSPDFITTVEDHPGVHYFVSVPSDTPSWLSIWYRRPVFEGIRGTIIYYP
jgi:SRSO17 transposase